MSALRSRSIMRAALQTVARYGLLSRNVAQYTDVVVTFVDTSPKQGWNRRGALAQLISDEQ